MKVKSVLNKSTATKTEIRANEITYYYDILMADEYGNFRKSFYVKKYSGFEYHNSIQTLPAEVLDAEVDYITTNSADGALVIATK